ncbi:MAG: ATP-binding protein [Gammaproteobacteria bacterium]|nr:ATP-binding protein [Gammaproteobacteria bacterium]
MSSPTEPPLLIVFTGWSGAGKSTLARAVATRRAWPLLAKDEIKEPLFATLGVRDRAWSKALSGAAYAVMFALARRHLGAGISVVLEGNFDAGAATTLDELIAATGAHALQVHCRAEPAILHARFERRMAEGVRHPGHDDAALLAEQRELHANARQEPLAMQARLLALDTGALEDSPYARAALTATVYAALDVLSATARR